MKKLLSGLLLLTFGISCYISNVAYAEINDQITVVGKLSIQEMDTEEIKEDELLLKKETILLGNQTFPRTNDSNNNFLFFVGLGILFMCFLISKNNLSRILIKQKK